jgi:hypothetical protein
VTDPDGPMSSRSSSRRGGGHRVEVEQVALDDLGSRRRQVGGTVVAPVHERPDPVTALQQEPGDVAAGLAGRSGHQQLTDRPGP